MAEVSRGISLSLILTSSVFGPIQEELIFRGLLQGAVFDNSWLGLVLTSSLFSFMHGPSNVPSFIFYLLGGLLLGFAYKKEPKLMGFYSSSHVLQCLATLILFIKIMKGKQKTVLAFFFL